MSMQPTMDILKKKRKVVRAAFACLCSTLEEVASGERPEGKSDFRILADLRVVERESGRFKETGRGGHGSVALSRYAGG